MKILITRLHFVIPVFLSFFISFGLNGQTLPCYPTTPDWLQNQELGSAVNFFLNCDGQDAALWRHLPSGFLSPGCEDELNFGSLRFDLGTLDGDENSNGYTFCVTLPYNMFIAAESELNDIEIVSSSIFQTVYCGTVDYISDPSEDFCNAIWIKYDENPGLSTGFGNFIHVSIYPNGADPSSAAACYNESINHVDYLIGGSPDTNGSNQYFTFSQGNAVLSELDVNPGAKFLFIPDNTVLTVDPIVSIMNDHVFTFGKNSSMEIPNFNQSTMTEINSSTLRGCSEWDGIKVDEFVEFTINDTEIRDATIAIEVEATTQLTLENQSLITDSDVGIQTSGNSFILMSNSKIADVDNGIISTGGNPVLGLGDNIFENCKNNGIYTNGMVQYFFLNNNTFDGCNTGISTNNSQGLVRLVAFEQSPNSFINCSTGITTSFSEVSIGFNNFENCNRGISLFSTQGINTISNNNIGFVAAGIEGLIANVRIRDNVIGLTTGDNNIGQRAINLLVSSHSFISGNEIRAERSGIESIFTANATIDDNDFFIDGQNSANGILEFFSNSDINDNVINMTNGEAGINTIGSSNASSVIEHNDIIFSQPPSDESAGILVRGGSGINVNYNDIQNSTDGIRVQNANMGALNCNEAVVSKNGIHVAANSNTQAMIANRLNGTINDILLKSQVGIQRFHGNWFNGGALRAEGLTLNQVDQSRFIIDEDIFPSAPLMPDTWNPAGLVDPQPDIYNETAICSGTIGAGLLVDPDHLCELVDLMSNDLNKDKAWINMYHTYRFYLSKYQIAEWPICLQNVWSENEMCLLNEMVTMEVELKSTMQGTQEDKEEQETLSEDYLTILEDEGSATEIESARTELNAFLDQRNIDLVTLVQAQKVNLESMNCELSIFPVWKNTYAAILNKLLGDEFSNQQKLALETTASLCAENYGDPVEWARGLVMDWSTTRYDLSENCAAPLSRKQQEDLGLENGVSVYPNPVSNSKLFLEGLDPELVYTFQITDIHGKTMNSFEQIPGKGINISNLSAGIYYLQFRTEMDSSITPIKFVVTK